MILGGAPLPAAAAQRLSEAVSGLLRSLYNTVAAQQLDSHTQWVKSGANLLLRALTRSPHFAADPVLPLLPAHALELLRWINLTVAATQQLQQQRPSAVGMMGAAASAAKAHGTAARPTAHSSAGGGGGGSNSGSSATADHQPLPQQLSGQGMMLLRTDDKVYLLLTKLVITATGLPATVADEGVTAAVDAAATTTPDHQGPQPPGARRMRVGWAVPLPAVTSLFPNSNGRKGGGSAGGSSGGRDASAACSADGSAATPTDPGLLCQLLEWSCSKVKQAMLLLIDPAGGVLR